MGPQALEHEAIKSAFSELWEPRFCYNRLAGKNSKYGCKPLISLNLELDCDSCCRGFEPHQPPHINHQLSPASQERGFFAFSAYRRYTDASADFFTLCVDADDDLIRRANFSLTSACSINGLLTAR